MNPCCVSLQTGTKIIAVFHLIFAIIAMVLITLVLITGGVIFHQVSSNDDSFHQKKWTRTDESFPSGGISGASVGMGFVIIVILIVVGLVGFILSLILLIGANKRKRNLCLTWFVISSILVLVHILRSGWNIINGEFSSQSVFRVGSILLQIYFLWVVWCFCEELKSDPSSSSQEQYSSNPAYYPKYIQSASREQHKSTNKAGLPNGQINV